MKGCGSQMTELELRSLLGCFLFSGDDSDKKIKILSGGEKARVALAKTIISKANFLMLDEPTNHLDMHSCDLLIEALNKYQGTYILVSHDRFFISKTANKIWEIDDHKIKEFKGGYDEWVAWKRRMADIRSPLSEKKQPVKQVASKKPVIEKRSSGNDQRTAINKDAKKELQKMQKRFQQLEEQIAGLNAKKAALESSLVDPAVYSDKTKFRQTEEALKKSNDELTVLNNEYEKVFEKILELETK